MVYLELAAKMQLNKVLYHRLPSVNDCFKYPFSLCCISEFHSGGEEQSWSHFSQTCVCFQPRKASVTLHHYCTTTAKQPSLFRDLVFLFAVCSLLFQARLCPLCFLDVFHSVYVSSACLAAPFLACPVLPASARCTQLLLVHRSQTGPT